MYSLPSGGQHCLYRLQRQEPTLRSGSSTSTSSSSLRTMPTPRLPRGDERRLHVVESFFSEDTNRIWEKSTQPHVSFASQFTLRSDLDSEPFREIWKPYTAPLSCFINSIQLFCASEKANLAPWT